MLKYAFRKHAQANFVWVNFTVKTDLHKKQKSVFK